MTDYKNMTVAQLKDLLKEKNMSTNGLKNELIERLQSGESSETPAESGAEKQSETSGEASKVEETATEAKTEEAPAAASEEKAEEATESAEKTSESVDGEKKSEEEEKTEVVEEKKPLTADEIKSMGLELLNKKLHRAKKFGQEQSEVEDLERMITRVEKFGVDMRSTLAKDLGLVKEPPAPKPSKAAGKPGNNKVKKPNNRGNNRGNNRPNRGRGGFRFQNGPRADSGDRRRGGSYYNY